MHLDAVEAASVRGDLAPIELVVAEAVGEGLDRYLQWTAG